MKFLIQNEMAKNTEGDKISGGQIMQITMII